MERIISATLVLCVRGRRTIQTEKQRKPMVALDFTHMMNRVNKNKTANSDSSSKHAST